MFYVYIIRSRKTKRFYIGSSEDIGERLKQHKRGKTRSLKNKGPFDLIRVEEYTTKTDALKREHRIKRYKGGKAFKKLIRESSGTSLSLV